MKVAILLSLLACISVCFAADKVSVLLMVEAQCPNCQNFINRQLQPMLDADGVWDIVDLTLLPWGNGEKFILIVFCLFFAFLPLKAYCETAECPSDTPATYDADIRECWNSACPSNTTYSDCFSCIAIDTSNQVFFNFSCLLKRN